MLDAGGPAADALTALGLTPEIAESLPAAESAKIQAHRKLARNNSVTRRWSRAAVVLALYCGGVRPRPAATPDGSLPEASKASMPTSSCGSASGW